jgi:outer membrane protein assembly factor BamE (lipoprotein component of BamABCDE complex)
MKHQIGILTVIHISILILLSSCIQNGNTPNADKIKPRGVKMDFIEFNKKVHSIKEGMNKNEVLALLGNPHKKENNLWDYDYTDGPAPKPGQHLCYGVEIIFKNDIVIEINKAMADMM